jgi:hypothetical protein
MSESWMFRYTDQDQKRRQSSFFVTKEQALAVACAYKTRGHAVTSLEGPSGTMTGSQIADWCKNNFPGTVAGG